MASKICMNFACQTTKSVEWKKGWSIRSGEIADLCYNCGSIYEELIFCETFHREETGWRECNLCNKLLHCGCAASKSMIEIADLRGVECIGCARASRLHSFQRDEFRNESVKSATDNIGILQTSLVENRMDADCFGEGKLLQLGKFMDTNESNHLPQSHKGDRNASLGHLEPEAFHPIGEVRGFLNMGQPSVRSSSFTKPDSTGQMFGVKDMYESLSQPSFSMGLTSPSETPSLTQHFQGEVVEGREQSKSPTLFQRNRRSRPILPKPSTTDLTIGSEENKGTVPSTRVARPPADGRGRNQLLPRYWPKITEQELQQLSGDLNSTIVPLFEKVLSASDAGRIGRLVVPKACAEAYFPPINQSEGLPIKIQDGKGMEWTLQFRFWPNNNSRMYVLEGVTPCIQSMQLRAGDTVTFSRLDPGGKLVIGCRKTSITGDTQDPEISSLSNGAASGETSFSAMPTGNGYSGISQLLKGSKDPHLNASSEPLNFADGDNSWNKSEKYRSRINQDTLLQPAVTSEKKKTRNIGSKNKRLLMHSEDAIELRLTWEEAQDLLRPPPSVKPSIVTIEDHEFEEYDEPPVFGKRTIFTSRASGGQEQWAQCDNCSKWRKLPVDVLLPSKWTCAENVWDSTRSSCSAPDEMSPKEVENIIRMRKDFKKRRITESHKEAQDAEPTGLDALASAAVLGDNAGGETSVGATTKHPRHRDGCSCIVCIQPPSGKGKHKPSCICNVCLTVKRRFKTLMMRRKQKLQSEQEELARKRQKDELEMTGAPRLEDERTLCVGQAEMGETSTGGQIDLNCHPDHIEDMQPGASMMGLVQAASFPLENYMKQNRIGSLVCEQQDELGPCSLSQAVGDHKEGLTSLVWESRGRGDEVDSDSNLV